MGDQPKRKDCPECGDTLLTDARCRDPLCGYGWTWAAMDERQEEDLYLEHAALNGCGNAAWVLDQRDREWLEGLRGVGRDRSSSRVG